MRNLLELIKKFQAFFVFLVFALSSFTLITKNNTYQRSEFDKLKKSTFTEISGIFLTGWDNIVSYFYLKKVNEQLNSENLFLKNTLSKYRAVRIDEMITGIDSSKVNNTVFHYVKLIKNSIYHPYNFLTIDKGFKQGIKPGMGVVSQQNVVGIVRHSSTNFSTVIPIINIDSKFPATLKGTSIPGIVNWDGKNYNYANLEKIPAHVNLNKGDTIFTNVFSEVFHDFFIIGFIENFELTSSEEFYEVKIKLAANFLDLKYLTVIENRLFEEQRKIEQKTQNE